MGYNRNFTREEIELISYLSRIANYSLEDNWYESFRAKPLQDGNMGSLRFFHIQDQKCDRVFKRQISECTFRDEDGVLVLASLYTDQYDSLFELDLWKSDFTPLIRIPIGKYESGNQGTVNIKSDQRTLE